VRLSITREMLQSELLGLHVSAIHCITPGSDFGFRISGFGLKLLPI
jgi:hypothetical protein